MHQYEWGNEHFKRKVLNRSRLRDPVEMHPPQFFSKNLNTVLLREISVDTNLFHPGSGEQEAKLYMVWIEIIH